MEDVNDKGKPAARRGRKAPGPPAEEVAGPPKGGISWGIGLLKLLRGAPRP